MCSCDWDAVYPDFYTVNYRKARKPHRCSECGIQINPGEKYRYITGKWDGTIGSFHTCNPCVDAAAYMAEHSDCWCPNFGEMYQAIHDEITEHGEPVPLEYIKLREEMQTRIMIGRNHT